MKLNGFSSRDGETSCSGCGCPSAQLVVFLVKKDYYLVQAGSTFFVQAVPEHGGLKKVTTGGGGKASVHSEGSAG